jgi:hypothetical protein
MSQPQDRRKLGLGPASQLSCCSAAAGESRRQRGCEPLRIGSVLKIQPVRLHKGQRPCGSARSGRRDSDQAGGSPSEAARPGGTWRLRIPQAEGSAPAARQYPTTCSSACARAGASPDARGAHADPFTRRPGRRRQRSARSRRVRRHRARAAPCDRHAGHRGLAHRAEPAGRDSSRCTGWVTGSPARSGPPGTRRPWPVTVACLTA